VTDIAPAYRRSRCSQRRSCCHRVPIFPVSVQTRSPRPTGSSRDRRHIDQRRRCPG
jgi:hypothetical protein